MKKMKRIAQFGIGLFILGSMYVISGGLAAMSSDVRVSTLTTMFVDQSAFDLPDDWDVKVWHGTPGIEIVREQKGTVLKLRSHQSNVVLYKTVQVDLAQHPQLTWEWKVTEWPIHGDAPQGTVLQSQNDLRIHYVVVRGGKQETGEWIQERRNVEQDYQQIFGENPPLVNASL